MIRRAASGRAKRAQRRGMMRWRNIVMTVVMSLTGVGVSEAKNLGVMNSCGIKGKSSCEGIDLSGATWLN